MRPATWFFEKFQHVPMKRQGGWLKLAQTSDLADPDNGIIAYLSERGLAILDKKIGDEVEFPLGTGGTERYRITGVQAWKA